MRLRRVLTLDGSLTLRARGAALPGVVWQRYVIISRWHEWSPQIAGVQASASRIGPGVTGTVRSPLGVGPRFRIDSVDEEARTWSWTARLWPVTLRLWHAVRPAGPGTETELRMRGPMPVLLAYAPLARLALGRLVRP